MKYWHIKTKKIENQKAILLRKKQDFDKCSFDNITSGCEFEEYLKPLNDNYK